MEADHCTSYGREYPIQGTYTDKLLGITESLFKF